jgi:hypothetical protein
MIKFKVINNKVILSYTDEQGSSYWVYPKLDKPGSVLISKTFRVTKNELISPSNESKDYNPDINTGGDSQSKLDTKKAFYFDLPLWTR